MAASERSEYFPLSPVSEDLAPEKRLDLSRQQLYGLMGLVIDHPWLTDQEQEVIQEGALQFIFKKRGENSEADEKDEENGNGYMPLPQIQRSIAGVVELINWLRFTPEPARIASGPLRTVTAEDTERSDRDRNGLFDSAEKKLAKYTDVRILGSEIITNPSLVPIELRYALGIGGEPLLQMLLARLEQGDKLAFMQVKKLPPSAYAALHRVIEEVGGPIEDIIDDILSEEENTSTLSSAIKEDIDLAWEEAKKLTHCKILSSHPGDQEVEDLERQMNHILDDYIDLPYATWKFWEAAVVKDVRLATYALGASVVVGTVLTLADGAIPDFLRKTIPPLMADIATNISAAAPFIDEDQSAFQKMRQMLRILLGKYGWALAAGGISLPLSVGTQILENSGNPVPAGIAYAPVSILPTYITKKISEKMHEEEYNTHGGKAVEAHPVQSALLPGSWASGVLSGIAVAAGGGENSVLLTATTEDVEPLIQIAMAWFKLYQKQKRYYQTL